MKTSKWDLIRLWVVIITVILMPLGDWLKTQTEGTQQLIIQHSMINIPFILLVITCFSVCWDHLKRERW